MALMIPTMTMTKFGPNPYDYCINPHSFARRLVLRKYSYVYLTYPSYEYCASLSAEEKRGYRNDNACAVKGEGTLSPSASRGELSKVPSEEKAN